MIITVRGLLDAKARDDAKAAEEAEQGQASPTVHQFNYSTLAMNVILGACAVVAIIAFVMLVIAAFKGSIALFSFGLVAFLIAMYQLLISVREKANLDLLANHFAHLSESAKDEVLKKLVDYNAGGSMGMLRIIEILFSGRSK